jgi:hypothetical protein
MGVNLKDHNGLHQAVGRAVLAGGAASLAGLFLPGWAAAAATALALGLAVAIPTAFTSAAWAVLLACGAGAATRWGGPLGSMLGAIAVGASLARGVEGGWRRLLATTVGAVGAATAGLIGRAAGDTAALAFLPSGIEALAVGAAGGFVVGVSSIARHVHRLSPPEEGELASLGGDGELGQLLLRAAGAYRDTVEALGSDAPQAKSAADDLVKRMARFGKRWREVEADAARSVPADVAERLAEVERRLAVTTDPVARAEFERARDAMVAQLAYLDEIARGRERAVAKLTHQVATLERLRLAAVRHRSVDAARLGAELQPVVDELTEAGGDLDTAAEALSEAAQVSLPPAPRIAN